MDKERKEEILRGFLHDLNQIVFVKSTNSITDEVKELNPVIEDMEAVIKINGEFDREDLINLLISRMGKEIFHERYIPTKLNSDLEDDRADWYEKSHKNKKVKGKF